MMAPITTFTLSQLVLDFDNKFFGFDVGNLSNVYGNPSTSFFHISYTPAAICFDCLWIGGILRLLGLQKAEEYEDQIEVELEKEDQKEENDTNVN